MHSLGPANNDHLSALRVAISVAAPSLLLLLSGRPELIIYAVFGALTGMYGRSEPHQLRLRHQLQAALVLLSGVGVGVFLSVNQLHSWWLVGIEALLAGAGSVYSDKVRLKPNGPFFGILALGACASVPTVVPWYVALLISAGSAAFSLLVGFGGWVAAPCLEHRGGARDRPAAGTFAAPGHDPRRALRGGGWRRRRRWRHHGQRPSALGYGGRRRSPCRRGPAQQRPPRHSPHHGDAPRAGVRRRRASAGPLGPLQFFPGAEAAVLAVLVMIFQFTTELFMTRHYGLAMVSFTPVILLMTQLAAPADPYVLIAERGIETVVGAVIGILVVVFIRSRRAPVPSASAAGPP